MKKLVGVLIVLTLVLVLLPAGAAATTCSGCWRPLIAGGGNPKSAIKVGKVMVKEKDGDLIVKYDTTSSSWCITETHLHVASSPDDIPQTKKGNPIPGQFDYSKKHPCVKKVKYPLDPDGTGLVIAAHAVVVPCGECCCPDCGKEETAWGAGDRFNDKNWAMYFYCDLSDGACK
jgi:hypothetical protein